MRKSSNDDNSTLKWNRAGYIFNLNQIIKACQAIGSLKVQASIKSRNLRIETKAYIEPKIALKARLIEDNFCKNCYNINSTIHYLLECPIAKYVLMILEYLISKVLNEPLKLNDSEILLNRQTQLKHLDKYDNELTSSIIAVGKNLLHLGNYDKYFVFNFWDEPKLLKKYAAA